MIKQLKLGRPYNYGGSDERHDRLRYRQEVAGGERFEFGKNWQSFLEVLDEQRLAEAESSLRRLLRVESLNGRSFLDIGSGRGLFSLAALRTGARRVHSFDYDPRSVACGLELRRRYHLDSASWMVEQGNVLDGDYLASLGQFDVVYSWGVLHHTGDLWRAVANVVPLVDEDGLLALAIYKDQGAGVEFARASSGPTIASPDSCGARSLWRSWYPTKGGASSPRRLNFIP